MSMAISWPDLKSKKSFYPMESCAIIELFEEKEEDFDDVWIVGGFKKIKKVQMD